MDPAVTSPIRPEQQGLDGLVTDGQTTILSLAWALQRGSNERFLLSGTVDILHDTPEIDLALRRHELSAKYFVYFRRFALSGTDGLSWYRACAEGRVMLPELERANTSLRSETLLAEPPWPALQCSGSTSVPGSCANDIPARTASLIPANRGWERLYWTTDEREAALSFLREVVPFDFAVDPEYLGAAHLVVSDPELLSVDLTREGSTGSGILLRVSAEFRGPAPDGFSFILYRHRPRGNETPIRIPLRGSHLIELSHKPFLFSYDVIHDDRGLIYRYENAVFVEGFDTEVALVIRKRPVDVPQVGQRPRESYAVPLVRDVEHMSSPPQGPRSAAQVLSSNRARQEKRRPPYQRWFDGSADAAAPAIRELLAYTRREVLIVDPYFDCVELLRFGLSLGRVRAPLRILTSAEGLRSGGRKLHETPGAALLGAVEASTRGPVAHETIEVRVMHGVRPAVHDRFVAVDDYVWLLGSSLNEFGSRGTMLVALPDPDPVVIQLADAWEKAMPLRDWVTGYRAQPRGFRSALSRFARKWFAGIDI